MQPVRSQAQGDFVHYDWPMYARLKIECHNRGVREHDVLKWAFGDDYKTLHYTHLSSTWSQRHPTLNNLPFLDTNRILFLIHNFKIWADDD